jgi:putative hydrolase of the HAD superfamily
MRSMLDRIRAVSLDLDDTLWEVMPVLYRAEARLQDWLRRHHPRLAAEYDAERFREVRVRVARESPERAHDMTWLRTEALRRCAVATGYDESVAAAAFEVFHAARNEVEFYPDVPDALARLAALVPVYALSNGNACVKRVGLGAYFAGAVAAHDAGAAKPHPRIYEYLVEVSGFAAHEILHVGDDPQNDVVGARAAGMPTAWMNRGAREWPHELPRADFEVRDLAELTALVERRSERAAAVRP